MTIKVCVTNVLRESPHSFQGYLGYGVSNIDDRKMTIKLLREAREGNLWDDLAMDYIYKYEIVDNDSDITDKDINALLLKTSKRKWERFVQVFEEKGIFEIRKINVD